MWAKELSWGLVVNLEDWKDLQFELLAKTLMNTMSSTRPTFKMTETQLNLKMTSSVEPEAYQKE